MNAGGNVGYVYEWLDEDILAAWLPREHVVEAVLGDPHPHASGSSGTPGVDPSKDGTDQVGEGRGGGRGERRPALGAAV